MGGGPKAHIEFGLIYFGQTSEILGFLVNNGPKSVKYSSYFNPNKTIDEVNYNESNFAITPYEAGSELVKRSLSFIPTNEEITPYNQIPVKFSAFIKPETINKGWRNHQVIELNNFINQRNSVNLENINNFDDDPLEMYSTLIIKFDIIDKNLKENEKYSEEKRIKEDNLLSDKNIHKNNDVKKFVIQETNNEHGKVTNNIIVFMKCSFLFPKISFSKTQINFGECKMYDEKKYSITVKNFYPDMPIDFEFKRIPSFSTNPKKGILVDELIIEIVYSPEKLGTFSTFLELFYLNKQYKFEINLIATCSDINKLKSKNVKRTLEVIGGIERQPPLELDDITAENFSMRFNKIMKAIKRQENKEEEKIINLDVKDSSINDTQISSIHNISVNGPKLIKEEKKIEENLESKMPDLLSKKIFSEMNLKSQPVYIQEDFLQKANIWKSVNDFKKYHDKKIYEKPFNNKSIKFENVGKNNEKNNLDCLTESINFQPKQLSLPPAKDKLFVINSIGKYDPTTEVKYEKKSDNYDENKIPFKINNHNIAASLSEQKEIELELDGTNLMKIDVKSKEFFFGQMFRFSKESKALWITNNLKTAIHISIEPGIQALEESYPKEMIITPKSTEAFIIVLSSGNVQRINYFMKYTINYSQSFRLKIVADIIPPFLKLIKGIEKFDFKKEKMDFPSLTTTQTLEFENTGNDLVNFKINKPSLDCFDISPMEGVVEVNNKLEIHISFLTKEYPAGVEINEDMVLNINHADPFLYKIMAIIPKSKIQVIPNEINLGSVHVGIPKTIDSNIYIKNVLKNRTVYEFENSSKYIKFTEQRGYIIETQIPLTCTILCNDLIPEFVENCKLFVRGGDTLDIKVKAKVILPDVYILQEEFNFGFASFGEKETLPLTIFNNSDINAKIIVDFRSGFNQNFSLILNNERNKSVNIDGIIVNLDIQEYAEEEIYKEDDFEIKDKTNLKVEDEEDDFPKQMEFRYFEFEVMKNSKLEFDFIFSPTESVSMNEYYSSHFNSSEIYTNFELKGSKEIVKALERRIMAKIVKSNIKLVPEVLEFEKTFIYSDKENYSKLELKVYNKGQDSVKWKIDDTKLDACFKCLNKDGILLPEYSKDDTERKNSRFTKILFTFTPNEPGTINSGFIIMIEQDNIYVPSKKVNIKGVSSYPRIYFDRSDIILPITPLDVESSTRFKIKNEGFDFIKLNCKVFCESGYIPVECKWLDSNEIGIIKKEAELEVSFISSKTLSFTAKIIFTDLVGYYETFIYLHGTTDNCSLTNFLFTERYFHRYSINTSSNSIILQINSSPGNNSLNIFSDEDKNFGMTNSVSGNSSYGTKLSIMNLNSAYYNKLLKDSEYILEFLRYVNCTSNVTSFPGELCSLKNNGDTLYSFIYNMSNKFPPGKLQKTEDMNLRVLNLKKQFADVISYLQQQGALLNTVLPDYLLDFTNFKKLVNNNDYYSNVLPYQWEKRLQKIHKFIHLESWVVLFYQIIKIYYLSRINLKNIFANIRNISDSNIFSAFYGSDYQKILAPEDNNVKTKKNLTKQTTLIKKNKETSKNTINQEENKDEFSMISIMTKLKNLEFTSNLYSKEEFILMKFCQIIHNNLYQHNIINITNFYEDFKDFHVFYSLLIYLFPYMEENYKGNKRKGINIIDLKYNVSSEKIINICKEYGIFSHVSNEYLSNNFQNKELILFVLLLFQNFKHLVPKQAIIFSGILCEQVNKSVVISNTTSKKLEYTVKIEGHEDFSLITPNEIKVDPGQELEVLVGYKSRTSKEQMAFLYFLNKNEGLLYQSAPMCYILKSKVTGRISETESLKISSMMYEQFVFKLPVKNKFKEKAEFEISLEIFLKGDKKQKNFKNNEKTDRTDRTDRNKKSIEIDKVDDNCLIPAQYPFIFLDIEDEKPFIKLDINQSKEIELNFLPISLDKYICNVILYNELVGEFQYTIEAEGLLPKILKRVEYEAILDDYKDIVIPVTFKNARLDFCQNLLEKINENIKTTKENKNRIDKKKVALGKNLLNKLRVTSRETKNFKIEISKQFLVGEQKLTLNVKKGLIFDPPDINLTEKKLNEFTYLVNNLDDNQLSNSNEILKFISKNMNMQDTLGQISNNNISITKDDFLHEENEENSILSPTNSLKKKKENLGKSITKKSKKSDQALQNEVYYTVPGSYYNLSFLGRNISSYEAEVIMKCIEEPSDIRIFKVAVLVKPKIIKTRIELSCPLGQKILQKIPIYNGSDKDWIMRAELVEKIFSPSNLPNCFTIEAEKRVEKRSENYFTLKFEPTNRLKSGSILTINNLVTKEVYEYDLYGLPDDPLAEGSLEFDCLVNEESIKEIAISNNTGKEAQYRVETDMYDIISGPLTFHVPNRTTFNYKLVIKPIIGKIYFGKISFINVKDGNFKWYTIKINAKSKPLENIITMKCEIRTSTFCEFDINAISKSIKEEIIFNVEYTGQYLSGDNQLIIKKDKRSIYKLYFTPLSIFEGEGTLHLYNENVGEYFYKINLISFDQSVTIIDTVQCEIGKNAEVLLTLENPSFQEVTLFYRFYDIQLLKRFPKLQTFDSSCIRGKSKNKEIDKNKIKQEVNNLIKKMNDRYEKEDKIGKNDVLIKKNSDIHPWSQFIMENGDFDYDNYDPYKEILYINPHVIIIPPNSSIDVKLIYFSSVLENTEEAMLVFSSNNKIGDWKFLFKGTGILPTNMPLTKVNTYLGGIISSNIVFKNPFNEKLPISIDINIIDDNSSNISEVHNTNKYTEDKNKSLVSLDDQSTQNASNIYEYNVFKIMLKTSFFDIEPFKTLTIPFSFSPQKLIKYKAILKIEASKHLKWVYPIEGITEIKSSSKCDFTIKTKSKQLLETNIVLDLFDYYGNDVFVREKFSLYFKAKSELNQDLINKSITAELEDLSKINKLDNIDSTERKEKILPRHENKKKENSNISISKDIIGSIRQFPLSIRFFPLKPFKAICELFIVKKSGAQWIFNCIIESAQGDPEDIIKIESQLYKNALASFFIQNIFTKSLKFKAYMSHDTSSEISVYPAEGILAPLGKDNVQFTVSFTPKEYGKSRKGTLIIDTDDIQWVYEVIASFIEYKKPIPEKNSLHKSTATCNIRQNIVLNQLHERLNYEKSLNKSIDQNHNKKNK